MEYTPLIAFKMSTEVGHVIPVVDNCTLVTVTVMDDFRYIMLQSMVKLMPFIACMEIVCKFVSSTIPVQGKHIVVWGMLMVTFDCVLDVHG